MLCNLMILDIIPMFSSLQVHRWCLPLLLKLRYVIEVCLGHRSPDVHLEIPSISIQRSVQCPVFSPPQQELKFFLSGSEFSKVRKSREAVTCNRS